MILWQAAGAAGVEECPAILQLLQMTGKQDKAHNREMSVPYRGCRRSGGRPDNAPRDGCLSDLLYGRRPVSPRHGGSAWTQR